jgi:16S rRNA (uracil1498-N3)-methyltransferase
MIPRVFIAAEGSTAFVLEAQRAFTLPDAPAHHLRDVLRMRVGDALVLFNVLGGEFQATVHALEKRAVQVMVHAHHAIEREPKLHITLIQALPQGDKMDWVVQKATELGVARIVPWAAHKSVLKLQGERATKRVAHWQQVAVAACEQCGRNRVPEVTAVHAQLPAQLPMMPAQTAKWRLDVMPSVVEASLATQPTLWNWNGARVNAVALWVGPEGGFTDDERSAAQHAGFQAIALGKRIFRTETAGLAAISSLLTAWEAW